MKRIVVQIIDTEKCKYASYDGDLCCEIKNRIIEEDDCKECKCGTSERDIMVGLRVNVRSLSINQAGAVFEYLKTIDATTLQAKKMKEDYEKELKKEANKNEKV